MVARAMVDSAVNGGDLFEWIHDDLEEYVPASSSADTRRLKSAACAAPGSAYGTGVDALDSDV